jgi:hypothetical protein
VKKIRDDSPYTKVNAMGLKYDAKGGLEYGTSVNQGRDRLVNELNFIANKCSAQKPKVILMGYSQGAHVILNALQSSQLKPASKGMVAAVAVFGDPSYRGGAAIASPGNGTKNGWFPRSADDTTDLAQFTNQWGQYKIRSWCYPRDQFCQGGGDPDSPAIHGSYLNTSQRINEAFTWIKDKYVW